MGRIGIAIAPSNPNRLWAVVDDLGSASPPPRIGGRGAAGGAPVVPDPNPAAKPTGGIYVSNDAGVTWKMVSAENRLGSRGWYFNGVAVDPVNPDRAYVINTSTYMTTDGGKTFVPVKGAPGGDDYHQLWINPKDGNRMVLSSDQGTVVSVDGSKTWSTWYNQPTAQIYHVSADNRFPYWLYGAQQDSGGVGVSTMSNEGVLSFRNWIPTCEAGESATVLPDPKDGNILYGSGVGRCDQALNVAAPLWRRWWFVLLACLAVSGVATAAYRYRVEQLLALERLRTRIAVDLHDDIGANLSQIAILSEVAQRDPARGSLEVISAIARETVEDMSDIVWAINPRHDRLVALLHRMRR